MYISSHFPGSLIVQTDEYLYRCPYKQYSNRCHFWLGDWLLIIIEKRLLWQHHSYLWTDFNIILETPGKHLEIRSGAQEWSQIPRKRFVSHKCMVCIWSSGSKRKGPREYVVVGRGTRMLQGQKERFREKFGHWVWSLESPQVP